jgi:hypothetical protein
MKQRYEDRHHDKVADAYLSLCEIRDTMDEFERRVKQKQ